MSMSWRELNKQLLSLTEDEVLALLNQEKKGAARATILTRLHQRYSVLRNARERMNLLKHAEAP